MYKIIPTGLVNDERGQIRFVNQFKMDLVKRFYIIKNANLNVIRGWRAHRIEQRWFYVLNGSFEIGLIEIDNWENPSRNLKIETIKLSVESDQFLYLPSGYGTALKALEEGSEILVFSDHPLEHASNDDYTFKLDYFVNYSILD